MADIALAQFLTARAAELRQLAGNATVAPWTVDATDDLAVRSPGIPAADAHWPHSTLVLEAVWARDAALAAAVDPQFVTTLADAIVDVTELYSGTSGSYEWAGGYDDALNDVRRSFARLFADHPDFDPAWRP